VAFTVPERLSEQNDTVTDGERKVFAALRQHLPEDYLSTTTSVSAIVTRISRSSVLTWASSFSKSRTGDSRRSWVLSPTAW